MRRRKMRFAWIENKTSRKTSFKKRRTGLVKKVRELSTLCGASAFIVIHGPGESDPPTVWPSVAEARVLYDQFRSVPDFERCKKMLNQESYLEERATKMAAQLRKHKDKMTAYVMRQVIGRGKPLRQFGTSELSSVVSVLEEKMKETKKKIVEYHHHHHHHHQTVGIQPPGSSFLLSSPVIPMEEVLVGTRGDHSVSWDCLFEGIMNTSTSTNTNTNTNTYTNNNMNVRSSGVDDQGNTMGMQVLDHQLFLGGTTSLGANYNYNNNVQPYFVAGRSSSSSSTGNDQVGIKPYGSHFGHGGNNIIIDNNVTSSDQMGLGNLGYLGSGVGNNITINGGFSEMGLAASQVSINHGGSSTKWMGNIIGSTNTILDLHNPNFGHFVGSGGVDEDVGILIGVGSGDDGNMRENENDFGTDNNIFPFVFGGGNN